MALTRELALQIDTELVRLVSRHGSMRMACVIGGQSIQKQAMELRNSSYIAVGTPSHVNICIEIEMEGVYAPPLYFQEQLQHLVRVGRWNVLEGGWESTSIYPSM